MVLKTKNALLYTSGRHPPELSSGGMMVLVSIQSILILCIDVRNRLSVT